VEPDGWNSVDGCFARSSCLLFVKGPVWFFFILLVFIKYAVSEKPVVYGLCFVPGYDPGLLI
jgi:hypothetical protein